MEDTNSSVTTHQLLAEQQWNLKRCDANQKWRTLTFKVKVKHYFALKVKFVLDFSKFHYNSVNVCRQVGIFRTNYRQPQQSTSNKKQSQAGLWFSTLLATIFKSTNTQPLVRGIHTFLLSNWRLQGGCQLVYRPVWLRALSKRQVYIFPFNSTEETKFI